MAKIIYFVVNYFCYLASPQKYFCTEIIFSCINEEVYSKLGSVATFHLTITFQGYHVYCDLVGKMLEF